MNRACHFDHYNFNVRDMEVSLAFYAEALGLSEQRRKEAPDGSYLSLFLTDRQTSFTLELTWYRDADATSSPAHAGSQAHHLCMRVSEGYDALYAHHQKMGCLIKAKPELGLHFIEDPDGYWIEIVPVRK